MRSYDEDSIGYIVCNLGILIRLMYKRYKLLLHQTGLL